MWAFFTRFTDMLLGWIINATYLYNICWEDPSIDHKVLKIQKGDRLFRIASSGNNALDYLLSDPDKLILCDLNIHQVFLTDLRLSMLKDTRLTHQEWFLIWGQSDEKTAKKVYDRMRLFLRQDSREFWDVNWESIFKSSIYPCGHHFKNYFLNFSILINKYIF